MKNPGGRTVGRLTFLVHPYCYAASLKRVAKMPAQKWQKYHEHETSVAQRWHDMLDVAAQNDVVVYHPCYRSKEELALEEHGRTSLGDRFITLAGRDIQTPEGATTETLGALAADICEAFRVRGKYGWPVHDLRVAVFSYNYAQDLTRILSERGYVLDSERTTLRAVGESFEGCAHTWTTMIPGYLGVKARVEMPYETTVPDSEILLASRYLRRMPLDHETAAYEFTGTDGAFLYFHRERIRLADPTHYVRLAIDPKHLNVQSVNGESLFPEDRHAGLSAAARRRCMASGRGRRRGDRGNAVVEFALLRAALEPRGEPSRDLPGPE